MKYPRLIFFLLSGLLAGCSSFNKDEFKIKKITGSPSFYVPIAFGDLTLQGILKKMKDNDVTLQSEDGLYYLSYKQSKKSNPASTFIALEDHNLSRTTRFPGATLPANTTEKALNHASETPSFGNFAPKRLTEIKFKTATLAITLSDEGFDTVSPGIEVEIKIPGLTKDGVAFTRRQPIGPATQAFSLDEYVMTLNNNNAFTYELTIIETPHTEEIAYPLISLNARLRFDAMEFSHLKGYLGDYDISIPNMTYDLGASSPKLKEGEFTVINPTFDIVLYNGFGAPIEFTFNTLDVKSRKGNIIPLEIDKPNPLTMWQPVGLNQPNGVTRVKATNSKEAFSKRPKTLRFYSHAFMNRAKDMQENFCSDTSTVGWRYHLKYPLYGNAEKSFARDTVDINASNIIVEDVKDAALVLNMNNQMPTDLLIQIYLSDNKGENFEKLLTANNLLIKSSEVNSKGELTAAGVADKEIPIDKEGLKRLTAAKKIIFGADFATGHAPKDVQFRVGQILKVQLGLKTTLKVTYVSK